MDARLESLTGKARYDVVRYLIPRLKSHFGPLRPDQIDERTIARYVAGLPGKGRTDLEELKAALPASFKKAVKLPPTGAPRTLFLTAQQQTALLEAATRYHVKLFILIALNTGARHGAILDLTWKRVAPDCTWVDFSDPAKPVTNKRRVVVPCSPELRAALADARSLAQTGHVIEWQGARLFRIHDAFERTAIRAGLIDGERVVEQGPKKGLVVPVTWVTPHVLKHTAISNLGALGFSADDAGEFTGTSVKIVRRVYRHIHVGRLGEMALALGRFRTTGPKTLTEDFSTMPTKPLTRMVGATGIEPVTPTMST